MQGQEELIVNREIGRHLSSLTTADSPHGTQANGLITEPQEMRKAIKQTITAGTH